MEIPYPVVTIKARDWQQTQGQYRVDGKWEVCVGHIAGFLIEETEDTLVIAHQLFFQDGYEAHWDARYTTTIPKETVLERKEAP